MRWKCPSCNNIFSKEEASRHGFLCPKCSVRLIRSEVKTKGTQLQGKDGKIYELQGEIGIGGQASIWQATSEGVQFALKFYKKEEGKEILKIYEKIQGLPHSVPLKDWGEFSSNDIFLVFPYYPLGHLEKELFSREGSIDWKLLKSFLVQMTTVLERIHAKVIVHRDVKPENIMVMENNGEYSFYLGDYGIATTHSVTTVNLTPSFAPPELVIFYGKGGNVKSRVNHKIDWWSLGVIILWLIDKNPFQATIPSQIVENIRGFDRDNYINALNIPDEWKLLLKGLLTKNPIGRWDSTQVKEWLSGSQNIPISPQSLTFTAIYFMGYSFYSYEDFASFAWEQDWGKVKNHLFDQGNVFQIIANAPGELRSAAAKIYGASEFSQDIKLALILWRMNPSLPFGFKGKYFPDVNSFRRGLLNPQNFSFINQLKREGLFSSYFSEVMGKNIYKFNITLKILEEIKKWEEGNYSPLSLVLLLDENFRLQYLKKLNDKINQIKRDYLIPPGFLKKESEILKASSVVDLTLIEEIVKINDKIKRFTQQGLLLRKDVVREFASYISQIERSLMDYIPIDEAGDEYFENALKFIEKFSHLPPQNLNWQVWKEFKEKYAELLKKKGKENFMYKNDFLKELNEKIREAQFIISNMIGLDESSTEFLQQLKQEMKVLIKIKKKKVLRLQDYKKLVEFEENLAGASGYNLKGTEIIKKELKKWQKESIGWLFIKKYWLSSLKNTREKLLKFIEKDIGSLSNSDLSEYYNFFHEKGEKIKNLPTRREIYLFRFFLSLSIFIIGFLSILVINFLSGIHFRWEIKWLYIPYFFSSLSYIWVTFPKKTPNIKTFFLRLLGVSLGVSLGGVLFIGPFFWYKYEMLAWKVYGTILGIIMWIMLIISFLGVLSSARDLNDDDKRDLFLGAILMYVLVGGFWYLNYKLLPKLGIEVFSRAEFSFKPYSFHSFVIAPFIFLLFLVLFITSFRMASLGMLLGWIGFCFFRDSWIFPLLFFGGCVLAFFSKPEKYLKIGEE